MRRVFAAALCTMALSACATEAPYTVQTVGDAREVLVRWSESTSREQVEAQAREACGGAASYLGSERRFDGFTYARFRCQEG